MKTYTVDADGVPALAFRAKDDDAAAAWLTGWVGKWYAGTFAARNKALTVRPATIPEQAAWRAQSVRMQCEFEGVEKYFADEEGEMPSTAQPGHTPVYAWRGQRHCCHHRGR